MSSPHLPTSPTEETLVEGLGHPEGPDRPHVGGPIHYVETYTGTVHEWDPSSGAVARSHHVGGGPNACLVGSDGHIYVTQNGGHVGGWISPDPREPSIQRIGPDGVEVVLSRGSADLIAPNDLAFGPDGGLYFTDSGRFEPETKPDEGRILVLRSDGTSEVLAEVGRTYPNGIVVEDDGGVVWVESFTSMVRRLLPTGTVEDVCRLPDRHVPDGLKLDEHGNLWITVTGAGGIDVVTPDGGYAGFVETGGVPLNCAFGGDGWLYVTDFGTFDTSGQAHMVGALRRYDVGLAGQRPFRGAIEAVDQRG